MSTHPQPNGGDKPLGKIAPASKEFVEAFRFFNKYSAQKAELIATMNRCDAGLYKKILQEQIVAHEKFIAEILEYLEMISVKPEITKNN